MNISWVTTAWSVLAGLALALGLIHLLAWMQDRRAGANGWFSLVAFSLSVIAILELTLMRTDSMARYGEILRWSHVPLFLLVLGMVGFVQTYLGTGTLALGVAAVALRLISLGLNFAVPPNLNYAEILSLRQLSFFGESVWAVAEAVPTLRVKVAELSSLLLLIFVVDASVRLWRRGGARARRRALAIGGSLTFFILFAALLGLLIHSRTIEAPYIMSLPFLGIMLAMGYELSRDMIGASRLLLDVRNAEEEAARHRDELTRISRAITLSEISSAFAHEINQPLTAILANAQAAERLLDEPQRHAAELRAIVADIVADEQRAAEVIRRIGAVLKRHEIVREEIGVPELLAEARRMVRRDFDRRGVWVELEVAPGLPRLFGDRVQIQQVLLNLLINAADASEGLEPERRGITLRAEATANRTLICVEDAGRGLPADAERMFEPFFTTKSGGHGLGLAISRTIARAHGGDLRAASGARQGAVFSLEIPVAT